MSPSSPPLDFKGFLCDLVTKYAQILAADLAHVPSDRLHEAPMGVARSPMAFTAECIGFNRLVADALAGKPIAMPSKEEIAAFFASIDTIEKAQAGLTTTAQAIVAGIQAASEGALAAEVVAPWGEPMPLYQLAYSAAGHMNYHDGQVNYVQALYGDSVNHWA